MVTSVPMIWRLAVSGVSVITSSVGEVLPAALDLAKVAERVQVPSLTRKWSTREWRNGRRAGPRNQWLRGREGSNPSLRTLRSGTWRATTAGSWQAYRPKRECRRLPIPPVLPCHEVASPSQAYGAALLMQLGETSLGGSNPPATAACRYRMPLASRPLMRGARTQVPWRVRLVAYGAGPETR